MKKEDFIIQAARTMQADHEDFVAMRTVCAGVDATYWRPLNRDELLRAYNVFCKVAFAELLAGGEIPLTGLGKLKVREAAARAGRNPRTGESIEIPASQKVVFTPGKALREAMHEKNSPKPQTTKKTQAAKQRRK